MMSLPTIALWFGVAEAGSTYGPSGEPKAPDDDGHTSYHGQPSAPDGFQLIEIQGENIGGKRSAYVSVPYGKGPMSVILGFHGGKTHNGLDMAGRLEAAEGENILLVLPNGTRTGDKESGWTGPDKEDDADPMRDVNFVRALIDELDRRYDIDRKRVYAVGFSGGAYLTDWLWCQASDDIHGFFVVSRAMPVVMAEQCPARPARPVGLILGTADDGLVNSRQMSFDDTLSFIKGRLECRGDPRTETLPDTDDSTTVHHSTWSRCARGTAFEYWEIEGGGHEWPGYGKPEPDKSRDVNATTEMVRFFRENGGL